MANNLKNLHRLIESATNSLPVPQAFVADLKASVEKTDGKNPRKPSRSYKPSSMTCIRQMFFQMVGTEQDEERSNACLVGICESGTDRHARIQQDVINMKSIGVDCEYIDVEAFIKQRGLTHLIIVSKNGYETKLRDTRFNLSFMCDGIIKYKGQYYILEIKTESIYKWQNREDVAEEHVPQGTAYSTALGIDQVMFLYENRDNCDKKSYILLVTEDMKYKYVVGKIEECDGYVSRLLCPPKPLDIDRKSCTYCRYKKSCQKAGK